MFFSLRNIINPCCYWNEDILQVAKCSASTSVAIWSVVAKSAAFADVHTQRNGPKPNENISLNKLQMSETTSVSTQPHNILHIRWIFETSCITACRSYIGACTFAFEQKCIAIVPETHSHRREPINGGDLTSKTEEKDEFWRWIASNLSCTSRLKCGGSATASRFALSTDSPTG